jgi:hypothetical protein
MAQLEDNVGLISSSRHSGTGLERKLEMAIYRLLQNSPLGPEEITILTDAYECLLRRLGLVNRNDPITELVAKKVIELGQRGVRDPQALCDLAIKELGVA